MVADHYRTLGFALVEASPDQSVWSQPVAAYTPPQLPMAITQLGQTL